jgi:hypothetical protein
MKLFVVTVEQYSRQPYRRNRRIVDRKAGMREAFGDE